MVLTGVGVVLHTKRSEVQSWSGHMHGFRARSSVNGVWDATNQHFSRTLIFLTLCFSLFWLENTYNYEDFCYHSRYLTYTFSYSTHDLWRKVLQWRGGQQKSLVNNKSTSVKQSHVLSYLLWWRCRRSTTSYEIEDKMVTVFLLLLFLWLSTPLCLTALKQRNYVTIQSLFQ